MKLKSLIVVLGLMVLSVGEVRAITATGGWSANDIIPQSGSLKLSFPAKGGDLSGTFSGGGGKMYQYGGRFSGSFTGGWNGEMAGRFDGWVSYEMPNLQTGEREMKSDNIFGSWSGYLRSDGTGRADFQNQAKYGLGGSVSLRYDVAVFEKEYGEGPPGEEEEEADESPEPTAEPSPSPSPSPSPEPRTIELVDLQGNKILNGKVQIKTKDGKYVNAQIVDGKIQFDKSQVKAITVMTEDGKKISVSGEALDQEKVVMGDWQEWQEDIKNKLQTLADILNGGESVDLDKHFKIDWEGEDNFHQPPAFDFLRNFGFRDTISFYPGYITVNGDMNTPAHEALGHALTEVIGEGNKFVHAGGPHDDPWQPTYNKRSVVNPMRWFGDNQTPVSDEKARGFAMSEGWSQFVGDKWQRELTNTPDSQSSYTMDKAVEKIEEGKQGAFGSMYADESGYGAKVENVVATAFNELYQGQALEETVRDFQAVREAYKENHGGKSFQNVNQYLEQKLAMTEDQGEKDRINQMIERLELE